MKIQRFKKSHKILSFYGTHFEYREPYQVLVDATFCQAALEHKVIIDDQLRKYFQANVKLLTTQCIILEAEALGAKMTGATTLVKKFYVHKCGHEGNPIMAAACVRSMTKDSRYIVASQDRKLQDSLRKIPGRCLIYLHKATPVLEEPSYASKQFVLNKSKNLLPAATEQRIVKLKQAQGLAKPQNAANFKQKKRKNPNPLSCKRSKRTQASAQSAKTPKTKETLNSRSRTPMKSKSRRTRVVPPHVKNVLTNNNSE